MTVVTVTVNQWHIKDNATEGTNKPVICVNRYEYVKVIMIDGLFDALSVAENIAPGSVNKTPCGASCWMEYEE